MSSRLQPQDRPHANFEVPSDPPNTFRERPNKTLIARGQSRQTMQQFIQRCASGCGSRSRRKHDAHACHVSDRRRGHSRRARHLSLAHLRSRPDGFCRSRCSGLQWWWRQWSARHPAVGDVDTAAVDSLKALDPDRPMREADIDQRLSTSAMRSVSS
jgi:hypothetical protein